MITLFLAMALAASQPPEPPKPAADPPTSPAVPATEVELAAIRAALDDQLADAESARLKDFLVRHDAVGNGHACGQVNAKNKFGAYVGYQLFYADLLVTKGPKLMGMVWSTDPRLAATMCKQRGL